MATIETDFAPELPAVPCFISSINQVVLNMIVNAAQAIKMTEHDGKLGRISIGTRQVGGYANIEIADVGCGMSESTMKKIFNPFFTTKPVGVGTGQGLAIAYRIINEQHGGMISVDSSPGKGSCFTISLPLTACWPSLTESKQVFRPQYEGWRGDGCSHLGPVLIDCRTPFRTGAC